MAGKMGSRHYSRYSKTGRFCVYFHYKADDLVVFYIGIGLRDRPHSKYGRSKIWHNIINKHSLEVKIVHSELTWEEATTLEKWYIQHFGRRDLGIGELVNLTDGGEGAPGVKQSPEHIEKRAQANRGRKASEETRQKQSLAKIGHTPWNKGVTYSEEQKSVFVEAFKTREKPKSNSSWFTSGIINPFANNCKGNPWSDARRTAHNKRKQDLKNGIVVVFRRKAKQFNNQLMLVKEIG